MRRLRKPGRGQGRHTRPRAGRENRSRGRGRDPRTAGSKAVDELTANGVAFDQVDSPRIKTIEKGIAQLGEDQMAWFKDPDGDVHAIAQAVIWPPVTARISPET